MKNELLFCMLECLIDVLFFLQADVYFISRVELMKHEKRGQNYFSVKSLKGFQLDSTELSKDAVQHETDHRSRLGAGCRNCPYKQKRLIDIGELNCFTPCVCLAL